MHMASAASACRALVALPQPAGRCIKVSVRFAHAGGEPMPLAPKVEATRAGPTWKPKPAEDQNPTAASPQAYNATGAPAVCWSIAATRARARPRLCHCVQVATSATSAAPWDRRQRSTQATWQRANWRHLAPGSSTAGRCGQCAVRVTRMGRTGQPHGYLCALVNHTSIWIPGNASAH